MRYITVHAAATFPSMDIDIDWIRNIHVNQNKWSDVGYAYFIKRDGTIEKGRPENKTGAHVGGHNTGNLGICMAGGLKQGTKIPQDNFTPEQYTSLSKLLDQLMDKYPEAKLMGHNDFPNHKSRGCPCFNQHAYFDWLKSSRDALYKPDDWYDHSKYDWHTHSNDSWLVPNDFYEATHKIVGD